MCFSSFRRGWCGSWSGEVISLRMVERLNAKFGLHGFIHLYQLHLPLEDLHQGPLTWSQADELTFQHMLPKVVWHTPARRIKQYGWYLDKHCLSTMIIAAFCCVFQKLLKVCMKHQREPTVQQWLATTMSLKHETNCIEFLPLLDRWQWRETGKTESSVQTVNAPPESNKARKTHENSKTMEDFVLLLYFSLKICVPIIAEQVTN